MKKLLLILVMLFAVGCNELTPAQMQEWLAHTKNLSSKLDVLQEVSVVNTEALKTIGVVGDDTLAKVEKVNKEIDRVQPQIEAVAAGIADVALTGETAQDVISMLQAGNRATAPFNPWSYATEGILAIVAGIAGYIAARKKKEAAESDAKYQAHKVGVEKTAITLPEDKRLELFVNIGEARKAKGVV